MAREALAPLMSVSSDESPWLESAADLLGEDDPGPTPFVVSDLIVQRGVAAIVGPYKVGKTWLVLELALSVASGAPAFGRFEVARGPVLLILEESGRAALHRRLRKLVSGRELDRHKLSQLYFSANRGINLSDPEWRRTILDTADRISPMLIVFDPLARVKGGAVDESSQLEIGPVLDFLRELREVSGATVLFVHHTGHNGDRMRGSSDLEAYWESKLTIKPSDDGYTLQADHREAPSAEPFDYSLAFDEDAGSLVLEPAGDDDELGELILDYLAEHPGSTNTELRNAVPRRAADTTSRLLNLENAGTVDRRPSERTDRAGRTRQVDGFFPAPHADSPAVPTPGLSGTTGPPGPSAVPLSRPLKGGQGTADPDNGAGAGA